MNTAEIDTLVYVHNSAASTNKHLKDSSPLWLLFNSRVHLVHWLMPLKKTYFGRTCLCALTVQPPRRDWRVCGSDLKTPAIYSSKLAFIWMSRMCIYVAKRFFLKGGAGCGGSSRPIQSDNRLLVTLKSDTVS
jgi:hypothetical protein